MEIVYVLIALAVLAAGYFLFVKKGDQKPELEQPKTKALPKSQPSKPKPRKPREEAEEKKSAPAEDDAPEEPEEEPADEAEAGDEEPQITETPAEPPVSRPSLTDERDITSLRKGLAKSRSAEGLFGKLKALFTGNQEIDASIADSIEEALLASDVGVKTTEALLERIKESLGKGDLVDSGKVWDALREEAARILDVDGKAGAFDLVASPTVVLMVGVNGAGKTTTIGKLATRLQGEGKTCVLAAGDTFRAAAVQQLIVWGDRIGCEVVRGKDGADPASVIFEAVKQAKESGADVVLADTAGRLHTKRNLMAELQKVAKIAGKAADGAPHEVLLVIDATTGQNAMEQAKEFKDALELTGLVLTKLDGTAKGGVVIGISDTLGLPVKFIGLGERADDLHVFSAGDFVEALLGKDSEASAA